MSKKDTRTRVLFVCIGNACRSPMAEAIARLDASDAIEPFSAGLAPIGYVSQMTEQTLMRNGYWMEGLESKNISPKIWEQADIVINMSGRPRGLAFREYSKVEDWEVEDPFREDLETHQRVFEQIRLRVGELAQQCRRKNGAAASAERRARARLGATSLIFMTQNEANGGMVFNISEDGLAVSAAMPLLDGPLHMRIQFPESRDWIEAGGRIAWKSKSNKEAGIRFVDLTEGARQHIKNWIASQAPSLDFSEQTDTSSEQRHARPEITSAPPLEKMIVRSPTSGDACEEHVAPWPFPPATAAASTSRNAKPPLSEPKPYVPTSKQSDKNTTPSSPQPASQKRGLRAPQRRLGTFVAVGLLIGFIALALEWVATGLDGRNESITAAIHRTAQSSGTLPRLPVSGVASRPNPVENKLSAPASEAKLLSTDKEESFHDAFPEKARRQVSVATGALPSPPVSSVASGPNPVENKLSAPASEAKPLSTDKEESFHDASPEKARRQVSVARGASPITTLRPPHPPKNGALARPQPTEQLLAAVANATGHPIEKAQPQSAVSQPSSPPQMETPRPSVNVASNAPAEAPAADLKEKKESPAPAKPPVVVASHITVLTDPYPSLRITDKRGSKKHGQGMGLQFGHLLTQVEPVYPEEAKQRGIQGTVKLHAVIGRNGVVEDLQSVSGPSLLIPAAMNAVRQWHYTETLLGGQSVETEQDVAVIFHLSNSEAPKE